MSDFEKYEIIRLVELMYKLTKVKKLNNKMIQKSHFDFVIFRYVIPQSVWEKKIEVEVLLIYANSLFVVWWGGKKSDIFFITGICTHKYVIFHSHQLWNHAKCEEISFWVHFICNKILYETNLHRKMMLNTWSDILLIDSDLLTKKFKGKLSNARP